VGRVARVQVLDLATFLRSTWRVEREIVDSSPRAQSGHFTGWATFVSDAEEPGLLRYVEHGTVELGAHRGPAFRRLAYHVEGPRALVHFDDGRYFHDLDLREGVWSTEHPCGSDLYRARFNVVDGDRWYQEWSVTGPHKDHLIRTHLDRVGGESGAALQVAGDGTSADGT
jgi:hypothetical protein